MFGNNDFKNVRIEKIKPFEIAYEKNTDTVWFENHNIEACIRVTQRLEIEHIHLQTNTIDFLADTRLKKIKGIGIQYEIKNFDPLFNLEYLTHLSLPENIQIKFDFSKFKIKALNVRGGAAAFDIRMGQPLATTNIEINTGVSGVNIKIPENAACSIESNSGLSGNDFDGFTKTRDNHYETPNFAAAKMAWEIQ